MGRLDRNAAITSLANVYIYTFASEVIAAFRSKRPIFGDQEFEERIKMAQLICLWLMFNLLFVEQPAISKNTYSMLYSVGRAIIPRAYNIHTMNLLRF